MSCTITKRTQNKTMTRKIYDCFFHAMLTHIGSSFNDVTHEESVTLVKGDILSRNFESLDFRAHICNEIDV